MYNYLRLTSQKLDTNSWSQQRHLMVRTVLDWSTLRDAFYYMKHGNVLLANAFKVATRYAIACNMSILISK